MFPPRPALFSALVAVVSVITVTTVTTVHADEVSAEPQPVEDVAVSVYQPGLDGAPARASDPVPPGYHLERGGVREDLAFVGAIFFGGPYLLSVVAGLSSSRSKSLLVPVAGPFLQLSARPDPNDERVTAVITAPWESFVLVMDGLAQAAGVITLIAGLASHRTVFVRDKVVSVRATPMRLGPDGTGLGLTGTF